MHNGFSQDSIPANRLCTHTLYITQKYRFSRVKNKGESCFFILPNPLCIFCFFAACEPIVMDVFCFGQQLFRIHHPPSRMFWTLPVCVQKSEFLLVYKRCYNVELYLQKNPFYFFPMEKVQSDCETRGGGDFQKTPSPRVKCPSAISRPVFIPSHTLFLLTFLLRQKKNKNII